MSGKIGIIIQARMSSSRLPGKSLKAIGGKPLVFYVVQRVRLLNIPVIVCTSDHASDDVLADYLRTLEVSVYRGSLENVLERYIEAAEFFEVENIVRVTADNPFVDTGFLQESLPLFREYDYVDGIYEGGLIKGTGFELVKTFELKGIPSTEKDHQEHVTLWLRENMNRSEKRIQLEPNPLSEFSGNISLTCDYPEDLELIRKVLRFFSYRTDVPIEEVVYFLKKRRYLQGFGRDHRDE